MQFENMPPPEGYPFKELFDTYFILWLTLGLILAILVIADYVLGWFYQRRRNKDVMKNEHQ